MVFPQGLLPAALGAYDDSSGDSALWIARIALAIIVLILGRRYLRLLWRRTASRSGRTAVSPNHPVILPPTRAAPRPDQSGKPVIPIEAVRDLLGNCPREFPADIQDYLKAKPPVWLKRRPKDELQLGFRHQDRIRREGHVVWAAIVQANSQLFRRGPNDCPASVIFSLDPWYDTHPQELVQSAGELFELKGTDQNDPDAAAFARMLTNEMTRAMMLRAPKRFTNGRNVFHSSVMLARKHLPKGFLSGKLFPVWVDPAGTGALLLVPAAFWPASLTAVWDRPGHYIRKS